MLNYCHLILLDTDKNDVDRSTENTYTIVSGLLSNSDLSWKN